MVSLLFVMTGKAEIIAMESCTLTLLLSTCYQVSKSVAEEGLGTVLALHLPLHAIGCHSSLLHQGNPENLCWPGEWDCFCKSQSLSSLRIIWHLLVQEFLLADDYNSVTHRRDYLSHVARVNQVHHAPAPSWILSVGRDKWFHYYCAVTGKRLGGHICPAWANALE